MAGVDAVVPAILVEGQPSSDLWVQTCQRVGVVLFWPERWDEVSATIGGGG
jgi:hypothetical protein